jgi:hypothetical protein
MYLFIIVFGAFNGLMFLPTLLSLIGPAEDKSEIIEGYKDKKFFRLTKERFVGLNSVTDKLLNSSPTTYSQM